MVETGIVFSVPSPVQLLSKGLQIYGCCMDSGMNKCPVNVRNNNCSKIPEDKRNRVTCFESLIILKTLEYSFVSDICIFKAVERMASVTK